MKFFVPLFVIFILLSTNQIIISKLTDTNDLMQQMTEDLFLSYENRIVSFGPRVTGSSSCQAASVYIYNQFQNMGLQTCYHNYNHYLGTLYNVEATLYGSDTTNIIIVSAHIDTVKGSSGADDDGSGVATVLSLAKIMSQYSFTHTIRFVCFSGEEQGFLGSACYANEVFTNKDYIVAVLNVDMIGYAINSETGNAVNVDVNTASKWIFNFCQNVANKYSIGLQLHSLNEVARSDHASFWNVGYDAIQLQEYFNNPYYHSSGDTIANMNISYATKVAKLAIVTLADLSNLPMNIPPVADAGPNKETFVNTAVELDGSKSYDGDNDTLLYKWSIVGLPLHSRPYIFNTNSVATFMGDIGGTYAIQLVVNDGKVDSFPDIVMVHVIDNPPEQPYNPLPYDNQTDVPITANISWLCTDPDDEPLVYDIYFGTNTTPLKIASSSLTTYTPELELNTTYYWKVIAKDKSNIQSISPIWKFTTIEYINTPPNVPTISGESNGIAKQSYTYIIQATDNENNQIKYNIEWGDNTSTMTDFYNSGQLVNVTHTWIKYGSYIISAKAIDIRGAESDWTTLSIIMPYSYNPLQYFLEWLFQRFPHAFPLLRHLMGY